MLAGDLDGGAQAGVEFGHAVPGLVECGTFYRQKRTPFSCAKRAGKFNRSGSIDEAEVKGADYRRADGRGLSNFRPNSPLGTT